MTWYRGNTHTHTSRSDADTPLDEVVAWYAARAYDWLAITDHWKGLARAQAEDLSAKHGILVIPGNELSAPGAHVVGLGITEDADAEYLKAIENQREKMQASVDWIRDRKGIPILAHPNWMYAWDAELLLKIRDCSLFEVHNASPDCNTFPAGGMKGTDDIWNEALNAGMRIYGVASDDSHSFRPESFHARHQSAHGAEGWTYVECDVCDEKSVLAALESGCCVASSGAVPVEAGFDNNDYVVEVTDPYEWFRFTTEFFGPDGVLDSADGRRAVYRPKGSEKWIRARVFCSSGKYLWMQPVFPAAKGQG